MTTRKSASEYQNNPFMLAVDGLQLVFSKAQSFVWVAGALTIIFGVAYTVLSVTVAIVDEINKRNEQTFTTHDSSSLTPLPIPPEAIIPVAAGGLILLLLFWFLWVLWQGIADDTAAQLAAGKKTTLSESTKRVFNRFFPYLWLHILRGVKIFLWSLLLVVPGIIMAVRYSLAGVAFFDKSLSANDAIDRSTALTKNGWLTTNASQVLFNMVTGSLLFLVIQPGINGILYRQFSHTSKKPAAHWLSWATLIAPIALYAILGLMIAVILIIFAVNNPQ